MSINLEFFESYLMTMYIMGKPFIKLIAMKFIIFYPVFLKFQSAFKQTLFLTLHIQATNKYKTVLTIFYNQSKGRKTIFLL